MPPNKGYRVCRLLSKWCTYAGHGIINLGLVTTNCNHFPKFPDILTLGSVIVKGSHCRLYPKLINTAPQMRYFFTSEGVRACAVLLLLPFRMDTIIA